MSDQHPTVNIRPGVSVLAVLRHLNYSPWYALAEFVDNSLQSSIEHYDALSALVPTYKTQVSITIDSTDKGNITIRDNAAGIQQENFGRAFRPAEIPPDRRGLSEFGMGMKSAACWFSPRWYVRTSALGELTEKTVRFDIVAIVEDKIDELKVDVRPALAYRHFTEIVLADLHRVPRGNTLKKVKEHLTDIYRDFIRRGLLELRVNDEVLEYEEPEILIAPYYRDPSGDAVTWKKHINFDLGNGLRVFGFAALRKIASTSRAGFALFRRGRLIQGSGDEGYRPPIIFGRSNSYTYQRLFGELHLEGFNVSHTKDGFQWDDTEEPFLQLLKEHLDSQPLPMLDQAEGHRVRAKAADIRPGAEIAIVRTADVIENHIPPVVSELEESGRVSDLNDRLASATLVTTRVVELAFEDEIWKVTVELTCDPAVGDWVGISERRPSTELGSVTVRHLGIRMSLVHPFMERFGGTDAMQIEPYLRLAVAVALSEIIAYDSGIEYASTFRTSINRLLRDALSHP